MKNIFLKAFTLIFVLTLLLSLASCDINELMSKFPFGNSGDGGENNGENGGENGGEEDELDGLVLISNGVAKFQIVYTAEVGADCIRKANDFVTTLRGFGIEVNDPIPDSDVSRITDCEIIIGANARNRGEDCSISSRYLGEKGYAIKVVGKRVVIAGGSSEYAATAWDSFVRYQMKISNKTTEITSIAIDENYSFESLTKYIVSDVTLGGIDINDYTLVYDLEGMGDYNTGVITQFQQKLYNASGKWPEVGTPDKIDTYEHAFIIRYTEDAGDYGFKVYFDEENFIIECSYANAFEKAFEKFASKYFYDRISALHLQSAFVYTDNVSVVYYKDFGAKGNGTDDDYLAMYNAHMFANEGGQTVKSDPGATYYVKNFVNGGIPVMTNVDLGNAKIIIDDRGSEVYAQRGTPLYRLARSNPEIRYYEDSIREVAGEGIHLLEGQTSIPWLSEFLVADSIVTFYNSNQKDYVRNGGNLDSGYDRMDTVIVDTDGNVDPNYPLLFEFETITEMRVYRTDDEPIIFSGGYFETICCRVVSETGFVNKYDAYSRGITIDRCNSTVKDSIHRMTEEPELDQSNSKYGERNESYPYHAFLVINSTYNTELNNLDLDGHYTYYEDKSTSGTPVAMGSYDFVVMYSIKTIFRNIVQSDTDICDNKYWGIMASNGVKQIVFYNCSMSRFDAHRGFWDGKLVDCDLGHSFNVIGGGRLEAIRVKKMTSSNFISLRSDYGATFKGDVYLEDCVHEAKYAYDTAQGGAPGDARYTDTYIIQATYLSSDTEYLEWDFGYTCYMPITMHIKNFVSKATKNAYVYTNVGDAAFDPQHANQYQITKSITFENMEPMPICAATDCIMLKIPVTVLNSKLRDEE